MVRGKLAWPTTNSGSHFALDAHHTAAGVERDNFLPINLAIGTDVDLGAE